MDELRIERYRTLVVPRGLIGVVHLPAMPGDPRHEAETFDSVADRALADAKALVTGGASGLIIENFGSVPFDKGTVGTRLAPHAVALMTRVALRCKDRFEVPIGLNCLRNDAKSALGIAAATGADFIRVNVHTGAMLTDQGIIEGEAADTLRYRRSIGASKVKILADVLVKHAAPLAPTSPADAARDCIHRGLADGLIVTGTATGAQTDALELEAVRNAVPDTPVLVGSGITADNAANLLGLADGAIVGTWLKYDGNVAAAVDVERVRRLAEIFSAAR